MRFGADRKGDNLLLAHMHPLNLTLAANFVGKGVEAVANDATDSLDARQG